MSDAAWRDVGAAWARWSALHRACTRPVTDALLEAADAQPGACVLDVACGAGDPALELARRVRPGGRVDAIDSSEEMLAAARTAAAAEGLDVRFGVAEAEHPPLGPYDAVTCRFGLMFFPDPAAAVGAWRAVARRRAPIAVATWAGPEANPMSALRVEAARDVLGEDLPPTSPGIDALGSAEALRRVIEGARLRRVDLRPVDVTWAADHAETLAAMIVDLHPPLARLLASRPPGDRNRLVGRLATLLSLRGGALPGRAWVASARA